MSTPESEGDSESKIDRIGKCGIDPRSQLRVFPVVFHSAAELQPGANGRCNIQFEAPCIQQPPPFAAVQIPLRNHVQHNRERAEISSGNEPRFHTVIGTIDPSGVLHRCCKRKAGLVFLVVVVVAFLLEMFGTQDLSSCFDTHRFRVKRSFCQRTMQMNFGAPTRGNSV